MGSYPMQARAVVLFLLGFVVFAAALAVGGKAVLLAAGLAILSVAVGVFLKCKRWEQEGEAE